MKNCRVTGRQDGRFQVECGEKGTDRKVIIVYSTKKEAVTTARKISKKISKIVRTNPKE